jgi:hypothetical protein
MSSFMPLTAADRSRSSRNGSRKVDKPARAAHSQLSPGLFGAPSFHQRRFELGDAAFHVIHLVVHKKIATGCASASPGQSCQAR